MRVLIFALAVFLLSCTNKERKNAIESSKRSKIINYLKKEFHINIDTSEINSFYKKELLEKRQSLELDSLINSKIFIDEYKPLQLSFIRYYNYFHIPDTTRENIFDIYLIEDNITGNFYLDYINPDAGMIIEDVCAYSSVNAPVKPSDFKNSISPENIDAYNRINSSRYFGESELEFQNKKSGIQSYLNAAFRFTKPTKELLDSLFLFSDRHLHFKRDILMEDPKELYDFLRRQAARIRKEPDYNSREKSLAYLKDQISLLLLQTSHSESENVFTWIFTSDHRLRIRRLLISGNKIASFSYFINEYDLCF
jgi:uncharacterized protein YqgQ